jgi:hypothetical protein
MSEENFYKDLKPLQLPITDVFQEAYFYTVPPGWHIIISDVKNSTLAVNAGKHNDVNLAAAGSLVAALNIAKKYKVDIPFFFGGDGSTVLVPEKIVKEVVAGLWVHNVNSKKNFGLEMHIGSMPVREVYESGHFIKIAKLEIDSTYSKAIAIGDGFRFAEQKIKRSIPGNETVSTNKLNLTGLECRWDKIKPSVEEAGNVCYLIESLCTEKQLIVYADVFNKIEEIYGDVVKRSPLSAERLKLLFSFGKLKKEMLVKFGGWNPAYFISTFFRSFFGFFYFKYNLNITGLSGNDYLMQLIAHADTLTIDGRINTIICGSQEEHQQFLGYLSNLEKEGSLIFGHYGSKESIMTCYIQNRNARHIHFVDGADGGYTEAAKEFKAKLKEMLQTQNNPKASRV